MMKSIIESSMTDDIYIEARNVIRMKRASIIPTKVIFVRDGIEIEVTELSTELSIVKKYEKEIKKKAYLRRGLNTIPPDG